jgi:zinc protease
VGLAGAGQFEIAIELRGAAAARTALGRVQTLLDDLRAGRIEAAALEGARNRIHTRRLAELESPAGRAMRLARYQVLAGDPAYLRRDLERLAAVDAGTLRAVVGDRLRDDQRVVVTGGVKPAAAPAPGAGPGTPAPATGSAPAVASGGPPAPRPPVATPRITRDDPRWQRPPAITADRSRPPRLRAARLRNGLHLWLLPSPTARTVRLDLVIPSGSADDLPGQSGVARQVARTLVGTPASPAGSFPAMEELGRLGATVEVAVDSDRSRLSLLVARAQLARALSLWTGLLSPPRFEAGARAALAVPAAGASEPERALARSMFGEQHPYTRALDPAVNLPPAALRSFFEQHYQPARATLVATGAIQPGDLAPALQRWSPPRAPKLRPARPARAARPPRGAAAPPARPRIVLFDRPGARVTELRLGHAAVSRHSPDHAAVLVTSELIGGRFGRLDRRLRLERPLALGLRVTADARRAGGPWVIEASFASPDALTGLQEILRTLDGLAVGEASLQEVARARVVLGRRLAARTGPRLDRAAALADLAALGLDERALAALPRALAGVDADDVRRVSRAYLSPDRLSIVVVGDRRQLEEILRELGDVEVRPDAPSAPGPATADRRRAPASALR